MFGSLVLSQWLPILNPLSPLRTAFAFACGLLIVAALEHGLVARALSAKPLTFLGRISYSLYLWHVPVLAAAGATAYDHRPARSALAVCASIVVATASFYCVERPLRQRWRERRPPVLAPSVQPSM